VPSDEEGNERLETNMDQLEQNENLARQSVVLKDYQPAMLSSSASIGSRKSSPRISTAGIGFKRDAHDSARVDTPTIKLDGGSIP
jgi:hypothetical protein